MENLFNSNSSTKLSHIGRDSDISLLSPSNITSSDLFSLSKKTKRLIDILVSFFALIFLFPLFLMLTGVLLVIQGRPVFIKHNRIGLGGKSFPCLKFRSMVTNAEEVLHDHLFRNEAAQEEWKQTHKLKNDPRVTPLGRVLRKSSVDELPQLLNIIRGEMSLVGPRPIVQDEVSRYGIHIEDYIRVRPGLTGLWQISGRSDLSYQQRVHLDVRYVREWSLGQDIVIILRTVPALLKSSGSY